MKRRLLTISFIFSTFFCGLFAQVSFSDDFESYNPGDLIAASSSDWSTWGGGTASDDAPVSDEQAFSGSNSLKLFSNSPNGGPADVILPFGGKYELGTFRYDMMMYVESGTGAYFNFQGEETVGQIWSASFYFDNAGNLNVDSQNEGGVVSGTFPYDTWFNINVTVDLTNNNWLVSIDGNQIGSFSNNFNAVASVDLYPVFSGGSSHFYVDDVSFQYEPPVLPDWDAAMFSLTMRSRGLTGDVLPVSGIIRNTGLNTINSFDVTWSDGVSQYTESYSGYNIASLETSEFDHPVPFELFDGAQTITATVSNPNGNVDGNGANNSTTVELTGYTPAPYKGVLIEEATGTWCGWCPRGAVFMERMTGYYPDHFMGVAVHNSDPMEIDEYDAGMTSLPGFTGFPSVAVEREQIIDPSAIELNMLPRLTQDPKAKLTNYVVYDEAAGEMTITIEAEFLTDVSGDYRLNAIIIENGVTGTSSGYNQVNYYAGGTNGEMGGYENLPSTVPAADMVYNEVARAILGGYQGAMGSLPTVISTGEVHEYTYQYIVPAGYDMENIEVISILVEPSGSVDNATKTKGEDFLSGTNEQFANHMAEVYPNPFSSELFVRLALPEATNVDMQVYNVMGTLVSQRDYGVLAGNQVLTLNGNGLANGIYYIHIQTDDYLITKKVQLIK